MNNLDRNGRVKYSVVRRALRLSNVRNKLDINGRMGCSVVGWIIRPLSRRDEFVSVGSRMDKLDRNGEVGYLVMGWA